MKQKIFLLMLIGLLLVASAAWAVGSGEITISWWTIGSGGGTLINEDYTLSGTAGQAEAGAVLTGGEYQLSGGYWPGGEAKSVRFNIYIPAIRSP